MNVMRWVLALPVFIISYAVIRWACLFLLLTFAGASGIIYAIGSCIVEGALAIELGLFAATKIAPTHKAIVIYVLSALVSFVGICSIFLSFTGNYSFGDISELQGLATIIITIITCAYTSYKVKNDGIESVFPDTNN